MNPIRQEIEALVSDLIVTRHHLHQHPELSDGEERTAAFVAERLRAMGCSVRTGVGGHGVVADIVGKGPGKRLAIRADIDALPIVEENEIPYRSTNEGVMHACGHDGHTTIGLGTARALMNRRDQFAGSVRMLFQPAEETVDGGRRMCEDGTMDGVDAIVALHGWPGVDVGQIALRDGAMMAAADTFDITIHGKGGHAAYPHATIDPIVIASQIVLALQTLASREVNPVDPVVVTVAQVHAGTAYNIIPGTARLAGTVRTLSAALRDEMEGRVRAVAEGICATARAKCEFSYRRGSPPVINHPEISRLIREVGTEALGSESVMELPHSSMGAEDFAFYLDYAPGAMFRLGLGNVSPLHTPTFNFTDAALPVGVEMFTAIAEKYLGTE